MHIGFLPTGGVLWTGGITYLKNLLLALHQHQSSITTSLFIKAGSLNNNLDLLKPYLTSIVEVEKQLPRRVFSSKFNFLINSSKLVRDQVEKPFRAKQVDVVFGQDFHTPLPLRTPTIGWIPDFQHIHLPDMMTVEDRSVRDSLYKHLACTASRIVVSSYTVFEDFKQFTPDFEHKASILSFVAYVPQSIYEDDSALVCKKYHLPKKFIYLPNQFWQHKNHRRVFEALKILKDKEITPFLVCTGNLLDYRNPTYFSDLLKLLSQWDLRQQIAILGLVPYEDVHQLMRQSICTINPSLFEGWSTTVEEAKSLGKATILSDIKVHREQNSPKSLYFNPFDAKDIADKLETAWHTMSSGPDTDLEIEARANLDKRMNQYAKTFLDIAKLAVKESEVLT